MLSTGNPGTYILIKLIMRTEPGKSVLYGCWSMLDIDLIRWHDMAHHHRHRVTLLLCLRNWLHRCPPISCRLLHISIIIVIILVTIIIINIVIIIWCNYVWSMLKDALNKSIFICRLHSTSSSLLTVHRTRLSTIGNWAFPVTAARVWNSLAQHLTSAISLSVLRSRMKTHLFRRSFPWL